MFDLEHIGAGLPVYGNLADISRVISSGAAVIQAPPGTGKTTLVPPLVANLVPDKVIVVAPRRVAVRAAARRLVQLSGADTQVGYSIRGEHKLGSRVEFMTPGVLLRRMLSDPELDGVDAVIVDEVHERQLDTDLVLGMLVELRELREDLTLVAMSATVDAQRFAELLGAEISTTQAPIHPLDITYSAGAGRMEFSREFVSHLASAVLDHLGSHSALVFVPGMREISWVIDELEKRTNLPVFPLHGQLNNKQQDEALSYPDQRIVVATAIAESSITVPGVRLVVDAGLSRVPKRDNLRGMTGLVTTSACKSSADQRAGRAGREGPGAVVRCYSESDFSHFNPHVTPEILSADLTGATLFVAAWGATFTELPLLDSPPAQALSQAVSTLHDLGALDDSGITDLGRRLVAIPADPRLARALVMAGPGAAPTIAALGENIRGDVEKLLPSLKNRPTFTREVKRLQKLAPAGDFDSAPGTVIGLAYPKNIAKRLDDGTYQLASGTRAKADGFHAPWIAVADISLSSRGEAHVHVAAEIDEKTALEIVGSETATVANFDGGKLRAIAYRRAGAIVLSSTPVKAEGEHAREAVLNAVKQHGLSLFTLSPKALNLAQRIRLLRQHVGSPWPDIDSADPEYFLGPEISALASGTPVADIDVYPAIQRLLPWPEANQLEELAPERLTVPSGRDVAIDYSGDRPTVSVKLQECFGLHESPVVCGQPVLFHLLSPAGRPLAVTDDLASFWAGPYQGVRSDMRGRYPKHPWPEDPTTAVATAKTKNAMNR